MDMFPSVWQTIEVNDSGKPSDDLIAICRIIPDHVSLYIPARFQSQIIASKGDSIQRLMNV